MRLICFGRKRNCGYDGISHWVEEDKSVMRIFSNIESIWPEEISNIPALVKKIVKTNKPWYSNLLR